MNSIAVATGPLKPISAMRPPSPASRRLKPSSHMPGSPLPSNAVAKGLVKPAAPLRPPSPAILLVKPNEDLPGSLFLIGATLDE
jgi:hypothetical protein